MKKTLCKSDRNGRICGVCAGIADYLNVDVTIIRIIATILLFFSHRFFTVLGIYLLLAIVLPEER